MAQVFPVGSQFRGVDSIRSRFEKFSPTVDACQGTYRSTKQICPCGLPQLFFVYSGKSTQGVKLTQGRLMRRCSTVEELILIEGDLWDYLYYPLLNCISNQLIIKN
jgi:hypothetical protein